MDYRLLERNRWPQVIFVLALSAISFGRLAVGDELSPHYKFDAGGDTSAVAYQDLISKFWRGPADGGMWVRENAGVPIGLWEWGSASNALYSYWKITGSREAAARLVSVWNWFKGAYVVGALERCGKNAMSVYGGNYALDDTAANAFQFLLYYEVAQDPLALRAAKGSLDCGLNRWSDGGTAGCASGLTPMGGLWYDDECKDKSIYMTEFALDLFKYFEFTGDEAYKTKSIDLDRWIGDYLQRYPGARGSQPLPGINCATPGACTSLCPYTVSGPYVDGLYWTGINSDGYTQGLDPKQAGGLGTPCQIAERGSVTQLFGNMAEAVLLAALYRDSRISDRDKAVYLQRIVIGSRGLRRYETGCGIGGTWCPCDPPDKRDVLLNDQDPFVNGTFAVMYVRDVLPLISEYPDVLSKEVFATTADTIESRDRSPDGSYGGSWAGPAGDRNCWSATRGGDASAEKMTVSAQAINMILAGQAARLP